MPATCLVSRNCFVSEVSVCVCVFVCVCVRVCVCACLYVYTSVHVCTCMLTCVRARAYVCVRMPTCVHRCMNVYVPQSLVISTHAILANYTNASLFIWYLLSILWMEVALTMKVSHECLPKGQELCCVSHSFHKNRYNKACAPAERWSTLVCKGEWVHT